MKNEDPQERFISDATTLLSNISDPGSRAAFVAELRAQGVGDDVLRDIGVSMGELAEPPPVPTAARARAAAALPAETVRALDRAFGGPRRGITCATDGSGVIASHCAGAPRVPRRAVRGIEETPSGMLRASHLVA